MKCKAMLLLGQVLFQTHRGAVWRCSRRKPSPHCFLRCFMGDCYFLAQVMSSKENRGFATVVGSCALIFVVLYFLLKR